MLLPAVAQEVGPDIECHANREGRRELHGNSRGDGKEATILPGAHTLNAIDGQKAGGNIGGALQIEEALKVEGHHDVALQELKRIHRTEIVEVEVMQVLVCQIRVGPRNVLPLQAQEVGTHDGDLRALELHQTGRVV